MARIITVTVTPANANLAGFAALQTTAGAGNLTLAATSAGDELAHAVALTSTGNISAVNFTITGTDHDGNAISETMAGPNNNTVYSVKFYKTVTQIAVDAAVGTNTRAGWDGVGDAVAPTVFLNNYSIIAVQVSMEISGTANCDIEETFAPIYGPLGTAGVVWYDVTALAAKTASTHSQVSVGAVGIRLVLNSYSNGAVITLHIVTTRSA